MTNAFVSRPILSADVAVGELSEKVVGDSGAFLPRAVRSRVETFFDADFSRVRIYVGPEAGSLGARAFARGEALFFAPREYQPDTREGQRLIVHELAHVVQQRTRRVIDARQGQSTIVEDPQLELEADLLASAFVDGRSFPGVPRSCASPQDSRPGIVQCQKWGWVGQRVLKVGDDTTAGPLDSSDSVTSGQISTLKDRVSNGSKPESNRVVRYNSTTCLNEVHQTRTAAWERATELATELTGCFFLMPTRIYYISGSANAAIPAGERDKIVTGPISAARAEYTERVWVRYKAGIIPDSAERGFYYEYASRISKYGILLIVEHIEDAAAQIWLRKKDGTGPEDSKVPARHFHVAFYTPEGFELYIEVNVHGNNLRRGVTRISESKELTARHGYEIKSLPSHHIYYLDD